MRLTNAQHELLERRAKKEGISKNQLIVRLIERDSSALDQIENLAAKLQVLSLQVELLKHPLKEKDDIKRK